MGHEVGDLVWLDFLDECPGGEQHAVGAFFDVAVAVGAAGWHVGGGKHHLAFAAIVGHFDFLAVLAHGLHNAVLLIGDITYPICLACADDQMCVPAVDVAVQFVVLIDAELCWVVYGTC